MAKTPRQGEILEPEENQTSGPSSLSPPRKIRRPDTAWHTFCLTSTESNLSYLSQDRTSQWHEQTTNRSSSSDSDWSHFPEEEISNRSGTERSSSADSNWSHFPDDEKAKEEEAERRSYGESNFSHWPDDAIANRGAAGQPSYEQSNWSPFPEDETAEVQRRGSSIERCTTAREGHEIVEYSKNDFESWDYLCGGAFGTVYKACNRHTKEYVALKEIRHKENSLPLEVEREILHLSTNQHENIVNLFGLAREPDRIYLVMELMDVDLRSTLNDLSLPLTMEIIKRWMHQLLSAVNHLHDRYIMHRDLKPENILLNEDLNIKIADFGLARDTFKNHSRPLSPNVQSLWYTAPEILLGSKDYDEAIDIWSIGCIMSELLTGNVLFEGDSQVSQLKEILGRLGTPSSQDWPDFKTLSHHLVLPSTPEEGLARFSLKSVSQTCNDLLQNFLMYDPKKRMRCREALRHQWFSEESRKRKRS